MTVTRFCVPPWIIIATMVVAACKPAPPPPGAPEERLAAAATLSDLMIHEDQEDNKCDYSCRRLSSRSAAQHSYFACFDACEAKYGQMAREEAAYVHIYGNEREAGYRWADGSGVADPAKCRKGEQPDFVRGCELAIAEKTSRAGP